MKAYYSNYGAGLDVVAPGSDILSTLPNDTVGYYNGLSACCWSSRLDIRTELRTDR